MPILQIGILGPLDIRHGNCVTLAFESVKARALLVYLAVESGRLHSREKIASMLWPDRPDSASLANLRHTLASLRTTLGERQPESEGENHSFFMVSPNTIQFTPTSSVRVDLYEFEQHLATVEHVHEGDTQKRINHLNAAVQLYRGSFLDGFSISGCPEFDDWLLLRRENISLKFHKVLRILADDLISMGELDQGVITLQRLLQLDPWNEGIHRKLMALLARQNQRSAALLQYEHCRKILLDDLGVNPEEETVHLFEEIRAGVFTDPGLKKNGGKRRNVIAVHTSSETVPSPFFVGRTLELTRLDQSLKLALRGMGQLVLITGEAGSGKTSLALKFIDQAMDQQADLLFAAGRCSAITGFEHPFLPFREVLQMLIGGNGTLSGRMLNSEHRRRLTESLPEVIKFLLAGGPDLIDSFIPREILLQRIEACGPAGRGWQQKVKQIMSSVANRSALDSLSVNLHEGITRMLTELACHRPLILFIDDLQWADAGSISLLHYLSKRLEGSRIILLGAFRPQDLAMGTQTSDQANERHPFERVRLELQRELGEIEVNLDRSEGIAFINALIDREQNSLAKPFRQMFFDHTAGNPLFTVELLHSMREHGHLILDSNGRWVEGLPFDWKKLPARVEAVIAERIGRLPPAQRLLLRAASVEGEIFTAEVTARVLGLEERQVLSWLSGPLGQEQQLVYALGVEQSERGTSKQPARLSRYRFRHFLFQKYLYSQMDPVERSTLHEATGSALEILSGPDTVDRSLHLAWHFQQGHQISRAAEYLITAGKQAAKLSAYEQAKEIYHRCLMLIQQLSPSSERARLEIQVHLARQAPLLATNGWGSAEAVQATDRAIELHEQSGEGGQDSSKLLALYFQVDQLNAHNKILEALARKDILLQQVNSGTERIYQTLGYMIVGQVYFFAGQQVPASEYFERAISNYRMEDQDALMEMAGYNVLNACLTWNAWSQWIQGYPGKSHALRQEVIALARRQAHPFNLAMSIAIAGALLSAIQNEPEQASAYAQECISLTDSNSVPMARILCKTVLGWAMVKQGEHETGFALLEQGINEWRTTGILALQPISFLLLADALSLREQTEEGLQAIGSAIELIEQTGRRVMEANVYWLQGEILVRERHRSGREWMTSIRPVECFERAITIARKQQARSLELRATISLVQLFIEEGEADEAISQLKAMIQQFKEGFEGADLHTARELLTTLGACQ